MAISVMPAAAAASRRFRFGTRAEYRVPARRVTPDATSPASPICGTHFGLTNAVISTTGSPASASAWTNAIFVAVGTVADSFCRPSRGPTSTIVALGGSAARGTRPAPGARRAGRGPRDLDERRAGRGEVAGLAADALNGAFERGAERQLHLHRLENHERLS